MMKNFIIPIHRKKLCQLVIYFLSFESLRKFEHRAVCHSHCAKVFNEHCSPSGRTEVAFWVKALWLVVYDACDPTDKAQESTNKDLPKHFWSKILAVHLETFITIFFHNFFGKFCQNLPQIFATDSGKNSATSFRCNKKFHQKISVRDFRM